MDENVSRILKMLEDGKITAGDAEKLIAAINSETRNAAGAQSASAPPRNNSEAKTDSSQTQGEGGTAKSFEFRWSQRRTFPFDLSGLGKQITDAVKKIDPERIVREARTGVQRGGKRWQDRFRSWSFFGEDEDEPPQNTLGQPTARAGETQSFDLASDGAIQIENNWGSIMIVGGSPSVTLDIEKEAWAPTEEEANVRLRDLKVETMLHTPTGAGARLEIRVTAPEDWRDGTVQLRLRVPEAIALRLATIFGEVKVENMAGKVEVHTVSGKVDLQDLRGEARAEGISGDIRVANIGGPLSVASKSGDISAENLSRGASASAVSGDVNIRDVEGGRVEAKSVSGDVHVENVGQQAPVDITIESVSGDVEVKRARGNIALKAVSGDVEAEHLEAVTLQGQTVSGDVSISLDAAFVGTLSTNTVSGDVEIKLPESSNFRFTLSTQSGDLKCDHAAHDTNRTETLWTGAVGTGAGNVTVQTLSGDVSLEKAE